MGTVLESNFRKSEKKREYNENQNIIKYRIEQNNRMKYIIFRHILPTDFQKCNENNLKFSEKLLSKDIACMSIAFS